MAFDTPITLAGGVKASRRLPLDDKRTVPQTSPAFAAFSRMSEALLAASDGFEIVEQPCSWDPAMALLVDDAQGALDHAMAVAEQTGEMRPLLRSDRQLILAARLISGCLGIANPVDRTALAYCLRESGDWFSQQDPGQISHAARQMLRQALNRLCVLCEALELTENASTETHPYEDAFVFKDA